MTAGLVEGAYLDADGFLRSRASVAETSLALLDLLEPKSAEVLQLIVQEATDADPSYAMRRDERSAVARVLLGGAETFFESADRSLRRLASISPGTMAHGPQVAMIVISTSPGKT
jgi:hypothetical protein